MTVEKAISIFKKQYPKRKVIGYWKDDDGIILNINPSKPPSAPEPCQFMVDNNGEGYWTIPIRHSVILNTPMIKI